MVAQLRNSSRAGQEEEVRSGLQLWLSNRGACHPGATGRLGQAAVESFVLGVAGDALPTLPIKSEPWIQRLRFASWLCLLLTVALGKDCLASLSLRFLNYTWR